MRENILMHRSDARRVENFEDRTIHIQYAYGCLIILYTECSIKLPRRPIPRMWRIVREYNLMLCVNTQGGHGRLAIPFIIALSP